MTTSNSSSSDLLSTVATVWLVEDSPLFAETISEVINRSRRLSCTMVFGSCEEALDALEHDLLPQVILMDIGLPGLSGIEGVRRVHKLAPAVPVVMLTVHQDNDKIFEAICAGASGYLLKSSPPQSILHAVEQVLAGGAAMDGQIARRVLEMFSRLAAPRSDYGLSNRERQILELAVDGLTGKQIAEQLFLSFHTVDGHLRNIYAKLHVHSRTGAVAKAIRERLI